MKKHTANIDKCQYEKCGGMSLFLRQKAADLAFSGGAAKTGGTVSRAAGQQAEMAMDSGRLQKLSLSKRIR